MRQQHGKEHTYFSSSKEQENKFNSQSSNFESVGAICGQEIKKELVFMGFATPDTCFFY